MARPCPGRPARMPPLAQFMTPPHDGERLFCKRCLMQAPLAGGTQCASISVTRDKATALHCNYTTRISADLGLCFLLTDPRSISLSPPCIRLSSRSSLLSFVFSFFLFLFYSHMLPNRLSVSPKTHFYFYDICLLSLTVFLFLSAHLLLISFFCIPLVSFHP